MTRTLRVAGFQLAFMAMLLRALLPAGWMPDASGHAFFTICTADGAVQGARNGHSDQNKPDDSARHQICPFAATAMGAAPISSSSLVAPFLVGGGSSDRRPIVASALLTRHNPQAPRAPPGLV